MGESKTFWYIKMSLRDMCPMEPTLVVTEGSYRESESGYKVGFLVVFLLGGPGSGVGSNEEGLLRYLQGLSS